MTTNNKTLFFYVLYSDSSEHFAAQVQANRSLILKLTINDRLACTQPITMKYFSQSYKNWLYTLSLKVIGLSTKSILHVILLQSSLMVHPSSRILREPVLQIASTEKKIRLVHGL